MAVFNSNPEQSGILQHDFIEDRTFPLQGGVLHLTEGEYERLADGDLEDTVHELGRLGVEAHESGAVETHIYGSEDPNDTRKVYLSTNPNDPLTVVKGTRVV